MTGFKIVETDNFGGDYPNEKFVNIPACCEEDAKRIAGAINHAFHKGGAYPRWWQVRPGDYKLAPGFEP